MNFLKNNDFYHIDEKTKHDFVKLIITMFEFVILDGYDKNDK